MKEDRRALQRVLWHSLVSLDNARLVPRGVAAPPFVGSGESTGVLGSWVFASIMQMFANGTGGLGAGRIITE